MLCGERMLRCLVIPHIQEHIHHNTAARVCVCSATYRDVSPEFCHVVVVAAEELGKPADGPLAAFVHRLISFKVLIVLVDRVVRQMHVELALYSKDAERIDSFITLCEDTSKHM